MKRALITGLTGQDGSYLAELLLEEDYEVYGLVRRTSQQGMGRVTHLLDQLRIIPGDLTDSGSLERAIKLALPHEVYNLAAQTFVSHSFEAPLHTADVTGLGALRLFEAVRMHAPTARVYQASSSEQYGNQTGMLDELTRFAPVSPYGCAKTFAHYATHVYRQSYKMYIACGIAFNHESPRRGPEFVTRKITQAVAKIKRGQQDVLQLGNTSARRDWHHARDFVRGAWLSLQQELPDDYVFATGQTWSVQEFVELAFNVAGLDWQTYVKRTPSLYRPTDIQVLQGTSAKAQHVLGWQPLTSFSSLVYEMVEADRAALVGDPSRTQG